MIKLVSDEEDFQSESSESSRKSVSSYERIKIDKFREGKLSVASSPYSLPLTTNEDTTFFPFRRKSKKSKNVDSYFKAPNKIDPTKPKLSSSNVPDPLSLEVIMYGNQMAQPLLSLWLDLCHRGARKKFIFRKPGQTEDIEMLNIAISKKESVECRNFDVLSVATIFKRYLRSLPESVLMEELFPRWRKAVEVSDDNPERKNKLFRRTIERLPSEHYHMLRYVLCLMQRITLRQVKTLMSAKCVAVCITPSLFSTDRGSSIKIMVDCVEYLIKNCDKLFAFNDVPSHIYKKQKPNTPRHNKQYETKSSNSSEFERQSDSFSLISELSINSMDSMEIAYSHRRSNEISGNLSIGFLSESLGSSLSSEINEDDFLTNYPIRKHDPEKLSVRKLSSKTPKYHPEDKHPKICCKQLIRGRSFMSLPKNLSFISENKRHRFQRLLKTASGQPFLVKCGGSNPNLSTNNHLMTMEYTSLQLKRRPSNISTRSSGSDCTIKNA